MTTAVPTNGITFAEAATLIPGNPRPSRLSRWAREGVRGVKLESFVIGGRCFTTREAIDEFLRKLNPSPRAVEAERA